MKTEQKLFEDWLRDSFPSNHNFSNKGEDGRYINIVVQGAWIGWQASASREGYKLAPIEPTEEMIDAGVEESSVDWKRLSYAYQAMINAI